jgi:hypothetical protein
MKYCSSRDQTKCTCLLDHLQGATPSVVDTRSETPKKETPQHLFSTFARYRMQVNASAQAELNIETLGSLTILTSWSLTQKRATVRGMEVQKPTPERRLAHGCPENSCTNEHLAPQKFTAAAPAFAGSPELIRPDERGGRQHTPGPASGRGSGESAEPATSPNAPGGPCAREMGRRVSRGGRKMRGR